MFLFCTIHENKNVNRISLFLSSSTHQQQCRERNMYAFVIKQRCDKTDFLNETYRLKIKQIPSCFDCCLILRCCLPLSLLLSFFLSVSHRCLSLAFHAPHIHIHRHHNWTMCVLGVCVCMRKCVYALCLNICVLCSLVCIAI